MNQGMFFKSQFVNMCFRSTREKNAVVFTATWFKWAQLHQPCASCSCADSPFLYPPAGHVVTGTLLVSLIRDCGHFLRKDPNTDFHPGLILLSAGVLSRKHFRLTVNDGVRRKASECMPLTTGKMNFYVLLTLG